jgi:hypothetical protein
VANSFVLVVFDSCRFDTFVEAAPRTIASIGPIERRWSYASWTAPSHYNLLMGLLPHASPARVYASEVYRAEYTRYAERLGIDGVCFQQMVPQLWLPTFLREQHGYRTHAMVSLPVLNENTPLATGFDTFELMPRHNDMAAMVEQMVFGERPAFYLLNVGETHYPYALPDEPEADWPQLSGVNGVIRTVDGHGEPALPFFDAAALQRLRQRQVAAVRYLDTVVARLLRRVPTGTWITVTSDHGELFGEDGYFGHGPIQHDKVFEVPLVEGRID